MKLPQGWGITALGIALALLMMFGSALDWFLLCCMQVFQPAKYRELMLRRQLFDEYLSS